MPTEIGTSSFAQMLAGTLQRNSDSLAKVLERLASGLRLNDPSDDPAGLVESTKLEATSRLYTKAIDNVNQTISLLNVANGGLDQLMNIRDRQLELAQQASNENLTDDQRVSLNSEAQQLSAEYNRIVSSTKYNGIQLFSSSPGSLDVNLGVDPKSSSFFTRLNLFDAALPTTITVTVSSTVTSAAGTFQAEILMGSNFGIDNLRGLSGGDFNGDGVEDLVAAGQGGGDALVYLGNGDGTFQAPLFNWSWGAIDVATGDVNNDGYLDFVLRGQENLGSGINVFIGNGDGTFKVAASYEGLGNQPGSDQSYDIRLVDLNGDNALDAVSTIYGSGILMVYLNNGNGTYKARQNYSLSTLDTNGFVTGDFNA